jgi:hypothetical protein
MLVSAVVEARQGGFITDEERKGFGLLLKGEGQAALVGDVVEFVVDVFLGEGESGFQQAGFKSSHAPEAPASQRHGLDQILFQGVGRPVSILVGLEEFREVLFGFAGEHSGLGGQAVLESVAGGVLLALIRDGAAGFFAVLAGGVRFGLRSHADLIASVVEPVRRLRAGSGDIKGVAGGV